MRSTPVTCGRPTGCRTCVPAASRLSKSRCMVLRSDIHRWGPADHNRQLQTTQFVTVDIMIRDQGVETLRCHHREAVFDAVVTKANWPTGPGVRIGPEEDLLVAGGRVRAELHLLGLQLSVSGAVTGFEPGALIEATGSQGGISATMVVRFADNVDDPTRHGPVETTVTWRFEARLPKRRAMLELPAAAAIKAAIPIVRARFIANIIHYLNDQQHVENDQSVAGPVDDRVRRPTNGGRPAQCGNGHSESAEPHPPPTPQ